MNKEIALKNLIDLDKIFTENNTYYWLSCGTLLGFYRDNDFIGHDIDTDICIKIESLNKQLLLSILRQGFNIIHSFGRIDDGFELALMRDGVKTDLFFFYNGLEYNYHSVYVGDGKGSYLKLDYAFDNIEITRKDFLGHAFCVPTDIESVLIQQYGNDWKVPNKNWDYYKSPKNIVNTGKHISMSETNEDIKKFIESGEHK